MLEEVEEGEMEERGGFENSRWWTLISRAGAAWIDKLEICTGSGASIIIIEYPLCRLWKPFREMIFAIISGYMVILSWLIDDSYTDSRLRCHLRG